ncbi:hypothetical protein Pelo_5602 [Pelomyxa schiedti]|nr:hypothetical protein Pelo_5602 [Pelomyxa schiedti]
MQAPVYTYPFCTNSMPQQPGSCSNTVLQAVSAPGHPQYYVGAPRPITPNTQQPVTAVAYPQPMSMPRPTVPQQQTSHAQQSSAPQKQATCSGPLCTSCAGATAVMRLLKQEVSDARDMIQFFKRQNEELQSNFSSVLARNGDMNKQIEALTARVHELEAQIPTRSVHATRW